MKVNFNQLDRGFNKYNVEYNQAVSRVLSSGWYILGKEVENFEKQFKEYIGAKHCVGLNSGLDALIFAVRALGIGPGDEVIVPANTYIATVIGITENGAIPVFVEPDEFYNIDADRIEASITSKTKAVLVVHLYGQAANMRKIKDITEKYSLYLIEDCAQSHGARFDDVMTGIWGDIGCFSFYPTKNLGAFGDAGCIVTNNLDLYEKIFMLRNYGSRIKYQNEIVGLNSRLDEIQAALLSVKLRHYEELKMERISLAQIYLERIKNPKIKLPHVRLNSESVWHLFVVSVENRDEFQRYLLENCIETQIHYPIPPHLSKAYECLGWKQNDFPITENYSSSIVSLPIFDGMKSEEIMHVVDVLNNY